VRSRGARQRLDAQQLTEQAVGILSVLIRVAAAAAVAGADVQVSVGAELELAAVVIGEGRVGELDHRAAGARIGGGRAGAAELVDPVDVPAVGRVIDVEATRPLVVGRKGHREQSLLAAAFDQSLDVQERLADWLVGPQDPDRARLLDYEQQLAEARCVFGIGRRVEFAELAKLHAAGAVADARLRDGRRGPHCGQRCPGQREQQLPHGVPWAGDGGWGR
jgi:hypothetical protein